MLLLFLRSHAGGGRKVKENDRFVCVFSKVNGSTLSEKIHVEWYVSIWGAFIPLNVCGPVRSFSKYSTSDCFSVHSKQEEVRSVSPYPHPHPSSSPRGVLKEYRDMGLGWL